VALALVMQLPDSIRTTAVGLVMAAFAISGVALSSLLSSRIQAADPSRSF
jgi:MFS transporter, OFA family, oxalate/formate antiporter